MTNLTVRTTDLAWEYWLYAAPHPNRKTKFQFDGQKFVQIHTRPTAKGISSFVYKFLFTQDQYPDTTVYTDYNGSLAIKPETFIDRRDWQFDEEYKPGVPLTPEQLIEARKQYHYSNWTTGDPLSPHGLDMPHLFKVVDHISIIVRHWHVSLSRYPLSQEEEVSAFFNAVGLGYLWHLSLPMNHGKAPGLLGE